MIYIAALAEENGLKLKQSILDLIALKQQIQEEIDNNPDSLLELGKARDQIDEILGKIRFDGFAPIDV